MPVSSAIAARAAINNAVDAAAGGRSFAGVLGQVATASETAAGRVPSSLPRPIHSQSVQKLLYLAVLSGAIKKVGDVPSLDLESHLSGLMTAINEVRQAREGSETVRMQLTEEQQRAIDHNLALASHWGRNFGMR